MRAKPALANRALIALLYRPGLRINEALGLYPKDLELADGGVRVLNGKGGRPRTVGLDPGAAAIIERWLDARSRCLALSLSRCHDMTPSDENSPSGVSRDSLLVLQPVDLLESALAGHADSALSRRTFGRHPVFCTLRGHPMAGDMPWTRYRIRILQESDVHLPEPIISAVATYSEQVALVRVQKKPPRRRWHILFRFNSRAWPAMR